MILFLTFEELVFFEDQPYLPTASSHSPTQLRFTLAQRRDSSFFGESYSKKSIARFYDAQGLEIKQRKWTNEMHSYATQNIATHPVPEKSGYRMSTTGKIFVGLALAIIAVFVAMAIYFFSVTKPNKEQGLAMFLTPPKVGDRYYMNLFGGEYNQGGSLRSTWVKVLAVQPDNHATVQLSSEVVSSPENIADVEHENFTGPKFEVKYKIDEKRKDVTFRSIHDDVQMEDAVRANQFAEYKLTGAP